METLHSFFQKNLFIGIDVHEKSWQVTILDDTRELKSMNMPPDPLKLKHFLQRKFPDYNYFSAYEAGYFGFSSCYKLREWGINCIVLNPCDIPQSQIHKIRKNDKNDSQKIALALRSRSVKGVFIPSQSDFEHRGLVRRRAQIVKTMTRIKNTIKAFLRANGIEYKKFFPAASFTKNFLSWLTKIKFRTSSGRFDLDSLLRQFEFHSEELKIIEKQLKNLSEASGFKEKFSLLTSVPGIGQISAMTLLSEIIDINRFKNLDQLASFVALTPYEHSSGEKTFVGRNMRRGNLKLKRVLIEASWVAMKHDPALKTAYESYKLRMVGGKAIIKIAKKLLNRIRHILISKEVYRYNLAA